MQSEKALNLDNHFSFLTIFLKKPQPAIEAGPAVEQSADDARAFLGEAEKTPLCVHGLGESFPLYHSIEFI